MGNNRFLYSAVHDGKTFIIIFSIAMAILNYQPFSDAVRAFLYVAVLIYCITYILVNIRSRKLAITASSIAGILFYVVSAIAYAYSGDIMMTGFAHLQGFLLLLVSLIKRDEDEIDKEITILSKVTIIASLIMVVLSILSRPFVEYFPSVYNSLPKNLHRMVTVASTNGDGRLMGFCMHPNATAAYSLQGVMCSCYFLARKDISASWKAVCFINIIISAFMSIFLCGSRTHTILFALLFVLYPFVYYIAFYRHDKKRMRQLFVLIIALTLLFIVAIVAALSISSIREYLINVVIRPDSIKSGSARTDIWKAVYEHSKGHRLLGISLNYVHDNFDVWSTHNIFVELFAIFGIPSLILFCIYFFYAFYKSGIWSFTMETEEKYRGMYIFIFVFYIITFVQGMAEQYLFNGYTNAMIFFTFFTGSISVLSLAKKRDN